MSRVACVLWFLVLGCGSAEFVCESDEDCVTDRGKGWCELESACSFQDEFCASGRRFGDFGPSQLAGRCVAAADEAVSMGDESGTEDGMDEVPTPVCEEDDECLAGYCGPDFMCHLGVPGDPCAVDEQCVAGECNDDGVCDF